MCVGDVVGWDAVDCFCASATCTRRMIPHSNTVPGSWVVGCGCTVLFACFESSASSVEGQVRVVHALGVQDLRVADAWSWRGGEKSALRLLPCPDWVRREPEHRLRRVDEKASPSM